MLDRLDDDDRVVDDEADREHQPEERQRVDREAEQREDDEGADERHRHRQHRDERGAPVLQEQEDDDVTSTMASVSVLRISLMPSETGSVVSRV